MPVLGASVQDRGREITGRQGLQSKWKLSVCHSNKISKFTGIFSKKKNKNPKITAIKTDLLHRFPSFSSDLLQTCIVSCSASMIQSASLGCGSYVKSATGTASMVCKERK